MARRNQVDAETLTFGVEIECTLPNGTPISIGSYSGPGIQVEWLPEGWRAKNDGSIGSRGDRVEVEIVSPILKGKEGLAQVALVCGELKRRGARVNASCGFHVHVGIPDASSDEQVGRVVRIVARHEKALYAVTGTRSREQGIYCYGIKDNASYRGKYGDEKVEGMQPCDRRHVLNVQCIYTRERPTVEFRVFSGTVKALKAVTFVRIALGLVHRGLEMARPAAWDRNHKPILKSGAGRDAVNAMLCELGWKGTYAGKVFGPQDAEEFAGTKDCLAEAMRLAAKYDAGRDEAEQT